MSEVGSAPSGLTPRNADTLSLDADAQGGDDAQPIHSNVSTHRQRHTEHLLQRAADAVDARDRQALLDEVVMVNGSVAEALARRYLSRGLEFDDLVQVAYLGLVKAAHGYRIGEGPGFLAYAVPTIAGEIKRHFRDFGWMIRPPRRVQELRGAVNATADDLYRRHGRAPTTAELALVLGVADHELDEAQLADGCFHALSLDAPGYDGVHALSDQLTDERDGYGVVEAVATLRPALRSLGERDRAILQMRFVQGHTQEQIGQAIGVSQMQVSRLLSRILGDLRQELADPLQGPSEQLALQRSG